MNKFHNQYLVFDPAHQPRLPAGFDSHRRNGLTIGYSSRLPVNTRENEQRTLTLLGDVVALGTQSIQEWLETALSNESLDEIFELSQQLTGRFVLIYTTPDESYVIPDAFAHKPIFYHEAKRIVASSLKLLVDAFDLNSTVRPDLQSFVESTEFGKNDGQMIGERSLIDSINRVLPNHVLALSDRSVFRRPLFPPDHDATVAQYIARQIQDVLSQFAEKSDLLVPVTAGWDTRVLLACLRDRLDDVYLYTFSSSGLDQPDVEIPRKMAESEDFDYTIHRVRSLSDEFRQQLEANHVWMRYPEKLRNIQFHYTHSDMREELNAVGIGAEVLRTYYDLPDSRKPVSAGDAAALMKFPDNEFAIQELRAWLPGATDYAAENDIRLLDLLYWEQRMGRWGARFPLEQDIALRTVSPFCNYNVLLAGLSTSDDRRTPPTYDLTRDIIRCAWPDLLEYPFNPPESLGYRVKLGLYRSARNNELLYRAKNWYLYE